MQEHLDTLAHNQQRSPRMNDTCLQPTTQTTATDSKRSLAMNRHLSNTFAAIAAVLTAMFLLTSAQALDGTWAGSNNGSNPNFGNLWSDPTNWVSGQIAGTVGTTNSTDTLTLPPAVHYTVELNANYNVQNINSNPNGHGHAIATQTGHTLSLTSGGAITNTGGGADKYFAPIRLEGGDGGVYTFSGSTMRIHAPVSGTATTGNYDLILSGLGTANEVTTQASPGPYVGSLADGTGGGTLSVIKAGTGTWSLVNASTYTGTTTVRNGTLRFSNANSFGTGTSAITLGDSGTGVSDNIELRWNENITLSRNIVVNNSNPSGTTTIAVRDNRGSPQLSGSLTLNRNIEFVNTNSGSLTVTGVIQGSGFGFTKLGENRLTLSNANTFSGDAINSGTGQLRLNHLNALQNATLDTGTSGAQVVEFNVAGTYNLGGLKGADDLALGANTISVGANNQSTAYVGILSGTGGLTKVGTGVLILSGNNSYSGATSIQNGTVSASNIVVSGGVSNLGNAASVVTLGSAGAQGTLSYTGNSATYTRGFIIGGAGGGRLDVTTAGQTLSIGTGNVTGSGLFTVGGAGNTTIDSNLTHTGGLTKVDGGTLTLAGANSYTGATSIQGGTLVLTGSLAAGSAVSVGNATLKGIGLAGGTVTVNAGGTLAPGASIGSLGSGALAMNDGSTFAYELNSSLLDGDLTYVVGTVSLTGEVTLTLAELASGKLPAGSKLTLISSTEAWNGGLFTYLGSPLADDSIFTLGSNKWQFNYNDTLGGSNFVTDQDGMSYFITMTVIPEPSAGLLLGLAGLVALRRRRRA